MNDRNDNAVTDSPDSNSDIVHVCQKELIALSSVSSSSFNEQQVRFNELLSNANEYLNIRSEIDDQTRGVMDLLYKYKIQILCEDVKYNIRQFLVRKGERIK
ncbi:hypothetical protein SG64_22685 [Enterobacter hormaechei subsp. xiangfangensis]|nr:hypothetical protein SG64_22685 [Enterobacter hormaechei subsp. xiangfangensis]